MKKTMLWGAIITLIGTQVHSDNLQEAVQTTQQKQETQQIQPATNSLDPKTQVLPEEKKAPVLNCDYKIPAEIIKVDQKLVLNWSERATTQSFYFNPDTVDDQLQKLHPCFTEQGWASFNNALEKSGNINAIKTQKLTVSSQIDGKPELIEANDNQWKINLPLEVVYQNGKEKVTQLLSINLTVGRKITGDLGIMQMIATPRLAASVQQSTSISSPDTQAITNSNTATGTPSLETGPTTKPITPSSGSDLNSSSLPQ